MKSLAQTLARQHGGSVTKWRTALGSAGVRPDAPESGLTPFERRAVERLVATLRPASPPAIASTLQPVPPPRRPESPLLRWAREATRSYLTNWEPQRVGLAAPKAAAPLGSFSSDIVTPPSGAELPTWGPELSPYLTEDRWRTLSDSTRRVLSLLVALERDPVLTRVVRALHPRRMAGAHPSRLLTRIAFAHTGTRSVALELPLDLFTSGRRAGLDWCGLKPPGSSETARPSPKPAKPKGPDELGINVTDLLTRIHPPASDAPPIALGPVTRDAMNELARRWRDRDEVIHRGHNLGGGGHIAIFEGDEGRGQVAAAATLAGELGLELFRLHAGLLHSRYIGETEARFTAVLDHLHERGAALFISGAQDLVAPRTEVTDARDRYANMNVNHILSELESWPGLCILCAPGLHQLDRAMQRRIRSRVTFPALDTATRREHATRTWDWLIRRASPVVAEARDGAVDGLSTLELGSEALFHRALELAFALETGRVSTGSQELAALVQRSVRR